MTRSSPFKKWRVATEITDRLEERRVEERYRGSFTSYLEGILAKYADGVLVEQTEIPVYSSEPDMEEDTERKPRTVHAVKVRRISGEQKDERKAG